MGIKHIDFTDVIESMDNKPEYLNGNSDLVKNDAVCLISIQEVCSSNFATK